MKVASSRAAPALKEPMRFWATSVPWLLKTAWNTSTRGRKPSRLLESGVIVTVCEPDAMLMKENRSVSAAELMRGLPGWPADEPPNCPRPLLARMAMGVASGNSPWLA